MNIPNILMETQKVPRNQQSTPVTHSKNTIHQRVHTIKNQTIRYIQHHQNKVHQACVIALIIAFFEVFFFNFGFWSAPQMHSIASQQAEKSIGPGISFTSSADVFSVTDSSQSYFQNTLDSPTTINYVQINPSTGVPGGADMLPLPGSETGQPFSGWVTVRVDIAVPASSSDTSNSSNSSTPSSSPSSSTSPTDLTNSDTSDNLTWIQGTPHDVCPGAPASTSIKLTPQQRNHTAKIVRIWYQQSVGTRFSYSGFTLNARPRFSISIVRIVVMLFIIGFVLAFRPGSRIYAITFNPKRRKQKLLLIAGIAPFVLSALLTIATNLLYRPRLIPADNGDYTYDFDEYARMANSFLDGTPWLNLPVPSALTQSANPYSTQVHAQLLSQGVTPIFWDHAFYHGHWYSYFGPLPALVFYAPYQAVMRIFTPENHPAFLLHTAIVVAILVALLAIAAVALISKIMTHYFPRTSLGTALLTMTGFVCASNLFSLSLRNNFYSIPLLSSLTLTCWGIWFWIKTQSTPGRIDKWSLAWGFVCIGLNLGCRPPFIITALLAVPLFWPHIKQGRFFSYLNPAMWKKQHPFASLGNDCTALLPMIATFIPVLAYNAWRFNSPFDFGNKYQITVTDLVTYKEPVNLIGPITWDYLFLPPTFSSQFPGLKLSPTPLSSWQLTEPFISGFFWIVPFCLCIFVGLAGFFSVRIRRMISSASSETSSSSAHISHSGLWFFTVLCSGLAFALCIFDAYAAGLSWRYMADFGWLFGLSSVICVGAIASKIATNTSPHRSQYQWVFQALLALSIFMCLLMVFVTFFIPGRIDSLLVNNPVAFFEIRSLFTSWIPSA